MIQPNDLINGLFELAGACFTGLNVRLLWRDKQIKGVHWGPTIYFTSWGAWNLFYYPSLGQWCSFAGGLTITAMNLCWLALVVRFWKTRPA